MYISFFLQDKRECKIAWKSPYSRVVVMVCLEEERHDMTWNDSITLTSKQCNIYLIIPMHWSMFNVNDWFNRTLQQLQRGRNTGEYRPLLNQSKSWSALRPSYPGNNNPILTALEGNTGKYKPADCSTSPTEGRACAKSKGLYFQVLPCKTVSIGFITRILTLLIILKFKLVLDS